MICHTEGRAELVQWSDFAPTSQKSDYFQILVRKRSEFLFLGRRNWCRLKGGERMGNDGEVRYDTIHR